MADLTLVADLAQSLLTSAAGTLDAPPQRQVISWQDAAVPAGNCDELAVCVPRLWRANTITGRGAVAPPQPRAQPSLPVVSLRVRLSLVCWPTVKAGGSDPSAASITAAALDAFTQNGALWFGICELANNGDLFSDVAMMGDGCLRSEVLQWTPTGSPQGGVVSGFFDVVVTAVHLNPPS